MSDLDQMDAALSRAPEAAAEDIVTRFCHTFGTSEPVAMEYIAWFSNEMGASTDQTDDATRALLAKLRVTASLLVSYQQKQSDPDEIRMSTRVWCLAHHFYTAAGALGPAELGQKMSIDKATVNKCLKVLQEKGGLPPLPSQRKPEACEAMSQARLKQLKPGKS